ncbi:phosphate ABC transporter substrate-binding protein PstS [Actinoplanes sp. L3-i22]|uniref:phosphate ABC transporter substrate-binding protein PstS n=1 Tax=Actinoplanes sp. L3-i22 TaxID=2836373 RepID=UPI001C768B75|nr:phosphate ABC transporter substrate-binding protein PstS [Actinoplanes sp. L3-i22]BCY15214.1 phosphate-binding protein PstS [Actinoplanes sp. L3-i22]
MKFQRSGLIAGIALTATIALTACGSDNTKEPEAGAAAPSAGTCVGGTISAQGSSAQKNAMDEWIKAYTASCADAKIDYNPNGSGAGVKAFTSGLADFAGSDSALKDTEQPTADAKCASPALNLPMVTGPIAVVYNVQGADGLQFSSSTLAKIFAGTITKWSDPAIAAENAGAKLPDATIEAVHRADESGTTDNFTKYLSKTAEADWTFGNAKAWPATKGGTGANKSDGIAAKIKGTPNTISYVELSFAENSSLQTAKVKNGAGEFVELTPESAGKTIEGATVKGTGDDLKLDIDYNTKTAGAYPIVLATYEIVCTKYADAAKGKAIQGFLKYTSSAEGQSKLKDLGYAPLPETVRAKVAASVAKIS